MINLIRKIIVEESNNFLIVDIDLEDFNAKSNVDMMEVFFAEGLLVLHSENFVSTEKRGLFRFDKMKSMCRVGCQKIKPDNGRITTTSLV